MKMIEKPSPFRNTSSGFLEQNGENLNQGEKSLINELNPDSVLKLTPKELADLFVSLDSEGKLEDFLKTAQENNSLVAMFSYWEKWLTREQQKLLDSVIQEKEKIYDGNSSKERLPLGLEKRFTEGELAKIFSNLGSIQLTFGCSKGCPFCGFDAAPGVRVHIPYSQLAMLFKRYGYFLNKSNPLLYWASEPSDYISKEGLEDKTYSDVDQLAQNYALYDPHVTSKESSDNEWLEFMKTKAEKEFGKGARISVYGTDKELISTIQKKLGKGNKIEMTGAGETHTKGMGISILGTEDRVGKSGLGCYDGGLLTPRGLYNVVQVPVSHEYPQGQMVVPFEEIYDQEIEKGQFLKDILRKVIVIHANAQHARTYRNLDDHGRFYKDLTIQTKNEIFEINFNEKGTITESRKIDSVPTHQTLKTSLEDKNNTIYWMMEDGTDNEKKRQILRHLLETDFTKLLCFRDRGSWDLKSSTEGAEFSASFFSVAGGGWGAEIVELNEEGKPLTREEYGKRIMRFEKKDRRLDPVLIREQDPRWQ